MSEEKLWRAVLAWAKKRSGVSKPTNQWAEEEKQMIRKVLQSEFLFKNINSICSNFFTSKVLLNSFLMNGYFGFVH